MVEPVLFFGAGASAPFGIPTMQRMVVEFEGELKKGGNAEERDLYARIKTFLSTNLGRPIDLEAVFTIVDSIVDWSPDRLGIGALFHAFRLIDTPERAGAELHGVPVAVVAPGKGEIEAARTLRTSFERYVRSACEIKEGQTEKVEEIWKNFFQNLTRFHGTSQSGWNNQYPHNEWAMFTTNYDALLEHYWLDIVQRDLNTGFDYNSVARMAQSNPERLRSGGLRLLKLHGSITWLQDSRWGLTEQRVPPLEMKTYTGRRFLGQVMLYPIEEKQLYVEPYMTMYLTLNRELAANRRWVVVGYSFGDRVVRDIFVRNSRSDTKLILLHPHANEIATRLKDFKGTVRPFEARFGEAGYQTLHENVSNELR